MKRILDWSESNYLNLNPSKTKSLYFSHDFRIPNIKILDENVQYVSHHKVLGLYIDIKLDYTFHINFIISRISFILRKLYNIGMYLPVNIKKTVAMSLCLPLFLYGIEIFSGTSQQNLNKLKLCFNRVVRYVYNIKSTEHISGYVFNVLGTDFQTFINIRLLVQFYKTIVLGKPPYLLEKFKFGRSSRTNNIICPNHTSLYMSRSFVVRVARLWNNYLPTGERHFGKTLEQFKKILRDYL